MHYYLCGLAGGVEISAATSKYCPSIRNSLISPQVVKLQNLALDLGSRHEPIVLLFHDLDFPVLHGEFEHGDPVVAHE